MNEVLYLVIPCYNEEDVLPVTVDTFLAHLRTMKEQGKISQKSALLYVDDGSSDATWDIIQQFSKAHADIQGIRLSRNRGQQNALYAGLMEAKEKADVVITLDVDGQDDPGVMEKMLDAYHDGCDIVYGVRGDRKSDSRFKRNSALAFYKLMRRLGVETVYNHAEYRLASARALDELEKYKEVNLFLRGIFPLIGLKSTSVYYTRPKRVAGKTKYSVRKMFYLAFDGITSLSTAPLRLISKIGLLVSFLSFIGILWAVIVFFLGRTEAGWASLICVIFFTCGLQMICLGVLGEYLGRIYLEAKGRPRYMVAERTAEEEA